MSNSNGAGGAAASDAAPSARPCYGPEPVTPAARLLPETALKVPRSGAALSLAAMNAKPTESWQPHWNPFLGVDTSEQDPLRLQALQLMSVLAGAFQHPSEMFQAKTLIPVMEIFGGFIAQRSAAEQAALAPLRDALPPGALLRTPAHQFNVDGTPDNRVLFFSDAPEDQNALDALVADLGRQHKRVVVQWMHMSDQDLRSSPQGGTLMDIIGGKLKFGSSHVSGFSTGAHTVDAKSGKPQRSDVADGQATGTSMAGTELRTTRITTNWGDRSKLDDAQSAYAVHLVAIDYQAGAHDLIPDETLAAYKRNADMWDCMAALHVKFSSDGDTFGYSTYEWNPLELHDLASARDIAWKLANDWDTFSEKHGSFYCAEAQYSIANLGPQEETLLKASRYGNSKLGMLIKAFGEAPAYKGKPIDWCRQHPEHGWQHLVDLGSKGQGGIKSEWLFPLLGTPGGDLWSDTYSGRQTVFLEFIPEHIKGWQAYRPRNSNHLIATPMTTGMITWALMHQYMPTAGITVLLLRELLATYQAGSPAVKAGITALSGGADPLSRSGQVALAVLCSQLAGGFVLASLESSDGLKKLGPTDTQGLSAADVAAMTSYAQLQMLKASGYGEILTEPEKSKVRDIWGQFIAAMKSPSNWTPEQLRASLHTVDGQAARLEVSRKTPTGAIIKGLMQFVPPGAWAFWAQQPEFCQSYSVQYVATALHRQLARSSEAGQVNGPFEQGPDRGATPPGQARNNDATTAGGAVEEQAPAGRPEADAGPASGAGRPSAGSPAATDMPTVQVDTTAAPEVGAVPRNARGPAPSDGPRRRVTSQAGTQRQASSFGESLIWIGTRIPTLLLALGALALALIGLRMGSTDAALLLNGVRLPGKIAALRTENAPDPAAACLDATAVSAAPAAKAGEGCTPVAPAVRFVDRGGKERCYAQSFFSCPTSYQVGQDVAVLVDNPNEPSAIRIDTGGWALLWPLVLGVLAIVMGLAAWLARPKVDALARLDLDPPIDDGARVVSLAEFRSTLGQADNRNAPPLQGIAATAGLLVKGEVPLDLCELCSYMSALVYERIRDDGKDASATSVIGFLETFPEKPFKHITPFWKANTEAIGFVLDGAVFLVFRGTADWQDWKGNLDAAMTSPDELLPRGMSTAKPRHRGFAAAWAAVSPDVHAWLDAIAPDPATPVIITGHSLGGALSFLSAWELKSVGRNVTGVVTFGAALPGDSGFADEYKALGLHDRTLQLEFTQDLVPEVQKLVGYVPVGRVWEPKQLPFTSHRAALVALPVAWLVSSLQGGLFAAPKTGGASTTSSGKPAGASAAQADTPPFKDRARSWLRKLLVFAFFSSLLALAAHKMQRRYGLALSTMSYRKIRERRLADIRRFDPMRTHLTEAELAECSQDLALHLRAVRGTTPDQPGVFAAIPDLPRRLTSPTDIRWFNAFFPGRSW